jgi:hypothetical protein
VTDVWRVMLDGRRVERKTCTRKEYIWVSNMYIGKYDGESQRAICKKHQEAKD